MSRFNPPEIRFSTLDELKFDGRDLDNVKIADMILQQLDKGTLTRIKRSFESSVLISNFGELLINVNKLSELFRTGNSGAESVFIRKGIGNSVSPSKTINVESDYYISVFDFEAILSNRIDSSSFIGGKKYQYLCYVKMLLEYLKDHRVYRDVRNLYFSQVEEHRPRLKKERYDMLKSKCCEFSGKYISDLSDYEFAHIQSVVTNPRNALNVYNGVLIHKDIHRALTNNQVHDFEGMYEYCERFDYSLVWVEEYLEGGNF
ncbi:hypothetical protein ATY35_19860 [Vibrio cidicii]|uniref:Restriction endonuclease n=1 Tax=Vibrio cidicii TaxID=1763883 RepID=A0ABR5VX67_9VIBR|nr:hypothetical protein [Vibrio cidicii]KYN81664.1 hypothetical protein ATY35_19860 [Vibrio cidicii]